MRNSAFILALGVSTLLGVGCASKEQPATQAVASAEAALNDVRPDAARYVPDQLQAEDAKLAALKQDLAKKDYDAVLTKAPKFREEVAALEDSAVSRQTQLAAATREWQELNEEVPKLVEAIQSRVDNLKGVRLPKDVKKAAFEAAKADLETMKTQWAEATAAANAGNTTEATDKGRLVQAKGKEVSEKLAMNPV